MSDLWDENSSWRQQDRRPIETPAPAPKPKPVAHEVIPEGTTIYLSQRMPDGTVRDLEINAAAIVGAIDFRSTFSRSPGSPREADLRGGATSARVTLTIDLKPVADVPNGEQWMMRFIEKPNPDEVDDVPTAEHLLWGHVREGL